MEFIQILILFFVLQTTIVFGNITDTNYIAAIVNDNTILNSDIKNKIQIMQYNACNGGSNISQNNQIYNTALNQLITDNLIFQIATQENIKVNQTQIDQVISSIAHFQNMTLTQFHTYLDNIGLNYKKYSLEIHNDILKNITCNYIIHQYTNNLSSSDIKNIAQKLNFINFNKQFKLIHIIIDMPIPTSTSQIDASENLAKIIIKKRHLHHNINNIIKEYYQKNILPRISVKETEWISWKHIPVIFDQYLETAKKGDIIGPIQSYDSIHIVEIQDIRIQKCIFPVIKVKIDDIISKKVSNDIYIQQQLLKIKEYIENDHTTFTIFIKEQSKDFYSNHYKESNKWIDLEKFEPSIQKSLLSLKKNQISMPIYTTKGWCLIKLIDIDKLNYSTIIYERSYYHLLHQKFNELLNKWIQEQKSTSYIKIIN